MRVSSNSKMTDEEAKTFGSELKRLREEAGFTGVAFAELVGTSAGHISQMEKGNKKPSPELAERIADAFNVTVSDMLKPYEEHIWEVRRLYGKAIRTHREEKGIPMGTIARALGIPMSVYKEYEQGLCSITDREMDILDKLLGISEEPKVETVKEVVEVPAEIPAQICDLILGHIKDLQVSEDEQKEVWRYFNKVKLDAEERRLFG